MKFSVPIHVRFRDIDALGHVNNAVYFTYLEMARTEYFLRVTGHQDLSRIPFVVARAECNFRQAMRFGDSGRCYASITRMGRTSFTLEYRITDESGSVVYADGLTIQVYLDLDAGRPMEIPDAFRQKVADFEAA